MAASAAILILALGILHAHARVLQSQEDALSRAFPGARIQKQTVFLTDAQMDAVAARGGHRLDNALVYRYDLMQGDRRVGTAYMDAHRVRTLPETLLVAVDLEGRICAVEVLAFREPAEYMPGRRWYDQFLGRQLNAELQLKRDIHGVTGATLTARATVHAVRRMLATHAVLADVDAPSPAVPGP